MQVFCVAIKQNPILVCKCIYVNSDFNSLKMKSYRKFQSKESV